MLNIVLFGPPGAGKGTQSEKLIAHYGLNHLSTGDIFRVHIKNKTELGKLAQSYMDKGALVPDSVTISMLEEEVDKLPNSKGFIFDGFPRTNAQAQALDTFLKKKNMAISQMIALVVSEDELVKRLLLRGKESGRADDSNEEIIRNRIAVYNQQTAVVAHFYNKQNKFTEVNGIGSITHIFEQICEVIDNL